ncbi:hypothetical protein DWB77_07332 [Streptomyces hundungensis]|uniref:Leucine rich repeat variant n=1 Tax=Streptomyces hundungensis TaxID=1077946 RepID=A0A387HMH1_9ACTN|nr:hypothetical protein [Streptomyces hundungensis]AYG85116.1 hypothetical protein DWB77_07332 [Streptomyces hundungensis]
MSDSLHELWLRGIAFNPAAPCDVLIRLVDPAAGEAGLLICEGRDLPDAVIDAALHHPARGVRRALAGNRHIDPARLAPLATDPSGIVRGRLAGGPHPRPRWVRPLPGDILVTLLTARDGGEDGILTENEIAQELDFSRQIPLSFYRSMAGHDHPKLRERAAWRWQSLTAAQRRALLHDPDPAVQKAAQKSSWELDPEGVESALPSIGSLSKSHVLGTCALSPALVEQCFADGTVHPLTWNRHTPADAIARLTRHPEAKVRAMVAARPDLRADQVAELREDPDEGVRIRARLHPFPRTWAEYWAILRVIGHGPDCTCPITELDTEPSPDWFAACAASEERVLRRVAASWPGLPAEVVETLAQDEDEEVRIRLACHHPLAPPHLLLDVFVTRPVHRPHLLTLPALPRTGLAHLIGHPDPEVRALAAADPALTEAPLEDSDESVCRAAAANPSLTPEALEALLANSRTAEGAAANPSLPVPRMHALLDHCLTNTATPPPAEHRKTTPT